MRDWGKYTDISEFDLPVYISEALNERYYGKLQGLNKEEAMKKFGKDQVHQWRRGYTAKPPGGESLKDTVKRTTPLYVKYIKKDLAFGKNVLVVASHNALRSIIKYIERISDEDIIKVEMAYGELIVYELDKSLKNHCICGMPKRQNQCDVCFDGLSKCKTSQEISDFNIKRFKEVDSKK